MKKLFIIANWKSHKTSFDSDKWLLDFKNKNNFEPVDLDYKHLIICPSFTALNSLKKTIKDLDLPFKLGAQNISHFDEGAYTGEVFAGQVKELADYAIIGHSERRENLNESDSILFKKSELARRYAVVPIFCIQDEDTRIPENISIVAYEPPSAIGTGKPDTPENADEIAKKIKEKKQAQFVIYGGSVRHNNVKSFSDMPNIDGFLIGGASLNASDFFEIVKNA